MVCALRWDESLQKVLQPGQYFSPLQSLLIYKCVSSVSVFAVTQEKKTTAHPHCGGSGVLASSSSRVHWNKTCALGSTGLEKGEDWGQLACQCARSCPRRREEHLRKLGRLAASVSVLILPHICHWSSSAHMFLEKEAAKGVLHADQVKALCIYSNALLFTVWLLLYLAIHVKHGPAIAGLVLLSIEQYMYCTFSTWYCCRWLSDKGVSNGGVQRWWWWQMFLQISCDWEQGVAWPVLLQK